MKKLIVKLILFGQFFLPTKICCEYWQQKLLNVTTFDCVNFLQAEQKHCSAIKFELINKFNQYNSELNNLLNESQQILKELRQEMENVKRKK